MMRKNNSIKIKEIVGPLKERIPDLMLNLLRRLSNRLMDVIIKTAPLNKDF